MLPLLNQPPLDRICLISDGERSVHREATFWITGSGQKIHGAAKGRFDNFPDRGLLKGIAHVLLIGVDVAAKCLLEKFFLIAKRGPHTGTVNSHGVRQVTESGPFVTLFPKDAYRRIQDGRRVEPSRATHPRIVGCLSHIFDLIRSGPKRLTFLNWDSS